MSINKNKSKPMVSACLDNFDTKRSFRKLAELYPSKVIQLDEISRIAKLKQFRFNEIRDNDHLRLFFVEKLYIFIEVIFNSDQ